jgi:intracellular multiplication protein IcmW
MPDLSHEGSKQFWKEFMNGSIYKIIDFIEQTEDWVVSNDPKTIDALAQLSDYLEKADSKTEFPQKQFIHICAYAHLSQKLKIMHTLDTIQPGLATQLIQTAEKSPKSNLSASIFLKRNLLFERMRILSKILAPNRIQIVQKIYES